MLKNQQLNAHVYHACIGNYCMIILHCYKIYMTCIFIKITYLLKIRLQKMFTIIQAIYHYNLYGILVVGRQN